MDSAMEAKLAAFSETVLNEAKKRSDETDAKIEAIRAEKTERKHNEFLEEAYRKIQSAVTKTRRSENERVLRAENGVKHEILKRREEIIDSVFNEAELRLSEFAKSEKYKTYFEKKAAEAMECVGDGEKIIYVTERDVNLLKDLDAAVETVNERSFIGGVRVLNKDKGIIADFSFGELLSSERDEFLRKSGLSID